jgi:polyphosphate kinase
MPEYSYFDRDLTWLDFNYRVLEEADAEETPLLEKIRFLSIYCSNLDEFYRVRIPALMALHKIKKTKIDTGNFPAADLLPQITAKVNLQLERFGQILRTNILPALAARNIRFIYHQPVPAEIAEATAAYFLTQLLAFLQPVPLYGKKDSFFPENDRLYFLIVTDESTPKEQLTILNIPSDSLPRFYQATAAGQYILFIDDIIRHHLHMIFPDAAISGVYSFKITRDAELDLQDEYEGNIAEKIERQLIKRDAGLATRLLYEPGISLRVLESLITELGLEGASAVEGGRYHNLRDLASFPVRDPTLSYTPWPALGKAFDPQSLLQAVVEKDLLLHPPYESYDPVLRWFNEAAIDANVEEIYVTLYRVAKDSRIVHALISAARNGKKVTVFVELKARFDEANNLRWSRKMKKAGVKIIDSIPFLKVHAKIALVKRIVDDRVHYSGLFATGNLNENTARFYTDHVLLTGQHDLIRELELLFIFLSKRKDPRKSDKIAFHHLLVAQFNLQERFIDLIDREMQHAREGAAAAITIKMNNLEEKVLINKLYEASEAGVRINLIVRGICCCIAGVPGMSSNISITRIIDRYLEHGRVFIFHNKGEEEIFLGSADWMDRNIYRRIEVCFPLYDDSLKQQIRTIIRLQLENPGPDLATIPVTAAPIRPQEAIYRYLGGLRTALYCCLIFLLAALSACHLNEQFPSPLWFYRYSSNTPSKWDTVLNRGSFLELRPDGSYTQDFGHFDYGNWALKGQELYLTNQHHTTYIFRLLAIGGKQMEIYLAKGKIAYFEKQPRPSDRPSKDPFSRDNNQWRIPATHKENIDHIRQRLRNHYQFWETYFQWGSDNNISAIDVTDIPSPMKVYGNGFGLKRYDSLSTPWRSYFFDEEDCRNADTLIKGIFRRNKIKWPDTDDQSKLFVSGVQQVETFLK